MINIPNVPPMFVNEKNLRAIGIQELQDAEYLKEVIADTLWMECENGDRYIHSNGDRFICGHYAMKGKLYKPARLEKY
jgi:hypothetical protein